MRRGLFTLLFVLVTLLAPLAPTLAATQPTPDPVRDARVARATAEELFRLAADRTFNALYDRIHPDAQAVVPRTAAIGAFTAIYAQAQAGQAQILDVQMGPWTWGVTGKRYDYAAIVSFRQPYIDANGRQTSLDDTMPLVQAGGEWRWFFGSSKQFVDQVIASYGGRGQPITQGDLLQNVVDDLDSFYRDVLGYTSYQYTTPGVVVVSQGQRLDTGCGPASTGFWAFYCPEDQTVYLDEPLLKQLEQQQEPFAAAFVIAHEWSHHVQSEVGLQRTRAPRAWNQVYSIELELMADCMTGAWTLDVDTRGLLAPGDIDQAIQFTVNYLGDPGNTSAYDSQAHGTADERSQSFLNGYERGFLGCNVKL